MDTDMMLDMADPDAIQWDGFAGSIVGVDNRGRLVYNIDKMINTLVERDGMTDEEAMEYLEFNVFSAYVGELTPVHIYLLSR